MIIKKIREKGGGAAANRARRNARETEAARERLLRVGPRSLAARELLALVLGSGSGGDGRDMAPALLASWGSIMALSRARPAALLRFPGLGRVRVARLAAALELGRRATRAPLRPGAPVRGPRDLEPYLCAELGHRSREHFVGFYLDARHRILVVETVAIGSLDASLVHPREVFRLAVTAGAAAIIVAHNHPSGCARPSRDDLALTARLDRCGRLLGIEVLDHLVVGSREIVSIREIGWPPAPESRGGIGGAGEEG